MNRRKFIRTVSRGGLFVPAAMAQEIQIDWFQSPAGTTYLLNETFEGTGAPSGWSVFGSADPDYTGVALAGSHSLRYGNSTSDYTSYTLASAKTELWGKLLYRRQSSLPASFTKIIWWQSSGFSNTIQLILASSGVVAVDSGSIYQTTSATMSADTTYYVWWHYKQGSGSNAVAEVWFDAVNTRPTTGGSNYAGATNGNSTNNCSGFITYNDGSSGWNILDNCQVADTEFT